MRVAFFGLCAALVALGCGARPDPGGGPPEGVPAPRAVDRDPARDLRLVASFGHKHAHTNSPPKVALTLVNTSATVTYPVPKPIAGCEFGQYEPHLSFAAEQRSFKGKWEPLPPGGGPGCGLYGLGGKQEVVELKPGAKLVLTPDGFHGHFYSPRDAGRMRMTATYEYLRPLDPRGGGGPGAAGPGPRAPLPEMRGAPPFKLVSNTVEFDVVMPLHLSVRAKRALKVGETAKLSELLEIRLTNTTDDRARLHHLGAPELSHVAVNVNSPDLVTARRIAFPPPPKVEGPFGRAPRGDAEIVLRSGESVSLLGAGQMANGADAEWTGRAKGKFPLCVEFSTRDWNHGEKLFAFADLTVE